MPSSANATPDKGAIAATCKREALNVDDVEPSTHPFPLKNVLRVDEPGEDFNIDEVFEVAPKVEESQFRVPRILGES